MRQVIIRFVEEGKPQKRATLTFVGKLPLNFWEEIARPFLSGEKTFGKATKTLTVNIIRR